MNSILKNIFLVGLASILMITNARANESVKNEPVNIEDTGKVKVSTGKYITGGILGTTIGFGIGHAIQDRYHSKGLIFTLAEGAGIVGIAAGLNQCKTSKDAYGIESTNCDSGLGTIAISYGVLIGFHIWEIVDVWTGATPVETAEPHGAFILPENGATKVGYIFNF